MVGVLESVFEVFERGVVLAIRGLPNKPAVGSKLIIGEISTIVKNVEMFYVSNPVDPEGIGVFVEGKKEDYVALIGNQVQVNDNHDQN